VDDRAAEVAGTWAVEGPDAVTADGFAGLLRDDAAVPRHADGQAAAEALTALLGVRVDAVTASFFAMASRADAPDAAEAFGVRPTPLLDGLRITIAAAAALGPGEG
ncbi:MAG: hypothetical protein ACXVQJ_10820, partial [Actinomycetota bacterium]